MGLVAGAFIILAVAGFASVANAKKMGLPMIDK